MWGYKYYIVLDFIFLINNYKIYNIWIFIDGANDVYALNEADVSLAVFVEEASLASDFTSIKI